MNEAETLEKAGRQEKAEKRVRIVDPEPEILPTVKWKTIRFVELFFALGCMSLLLALFVMSPIHDDYMRFCKQLVKPGWKPDITVNSTNTVRPSAGPSIVYEYDEESMVGVRSAFEMSTTSKTNSDMPGLRTFFFKLSYAIILFALTATVILVLLLDHLSRFFGEAINKLPVTIILLLAASEVLSLIIMVLSVDIFLGVVNGLILAVSGLAFGMSVCFAADIVCTSVKGNG